MIRRLLYGLLRYSWQCANCGQWYEGGDDTAERPPCPYC